MSKITAEQIFVSGKTLTEINIDFDSQEIKELIKKTQIAQEEILRLKNVDPSIRDQIVVGRVA